MCKKYILADTVLAILLGVIASFMDSITTGEAIFFSIFVFSLFTIAEYVALKFGP